MKRKGLLGAYHLGILSGVSKALQIAEEVTRQSGCDIEQLFYTTAFQTGIDEFLIPPLKDFRPPSCEFVRSRIVSTDSGKDDANWTIIRQVFSRYLPDGWERNDKYHEMWGWGAFLTDLFEAMEKGASLLSVWGIPDPSEIEDIVPSELMVPLSNLVASFEEVSTASVVTRSVVSRENVDRLRTLLQSDAFGGYVGGHASLDDDKTSVPDAIDRVVQAGRNLVRTDPRVLAIRKSGVGLLSVTPRLIEAVFGQLPGAIADVAARLGLTFLENRQRVVVYDFREPIERLFLQNLLRMFKGAEEAHAGMISERP